MEFSFCMCNISRISLSHPTSFHYSTVWVLLVSTVNKLSLVVLQDFCPEVRCLFTTHLTYSGEHEWIRVCLSPCTCRLEALSHLYYLFSANLDSFSKSAYLAHICGDSHLIWRSIKKQNYWAKPFDRDSLTSPFFSCCVPGQRRDPQGRVYEHGLSLWVLPLRGEWPSALNPKHFLKYHTECRESEPRICTDLTLKLWSTSTADLTSCVCIPVLICVSFPPLRSVVSSSPISLARSASLWTLISSATPVTWAECAPHTTFPLTTHTDRGPVQLWMLMKKLVLTRRHSLVCFRSVIRLFLQDETADTKTFPLIHFHSDLDQSLCHMYCLLYFLYHYCTIVNKGMGKKLLLFLPQCGYCLL